MYVILFEIKRINYEVKQRGNCSNFLARIGLMHKTCDVDVLFKEIYRKRLGFISVYYPYINRILDVFDEKSYSTYIVRII